MTRWNPSNLREELGIFDTEFALFVAKTMLCREGKNALFVQKKAH